MIVQRPFIIYSLLILLLFSQLAMLLPASMNISGVSTADKVLLCTPSGYRWVSISALDGSTSPTQPSGPHCPLCYNDTDKQTACLSAALLFPLINTSLVSTPPKVATISLFFVYKLPPSRAPPFV